MPVSISTTSRSDTTRSELVLAWAEDAASGAPRYIMDIPLGEGGARCNCRCPSCGLPLTAVNAGKATWLRRPHFRHPEGSAKASCEILAARRAVDAALAQRGVFVLPNREVMYSQPGLSGLVVHRGRAVCQGGEVHVVSSSFIDEATAHLTLEDGRKLLVTLRGRAALLPAADTSRVDACIEIEVDDPAIAQMAPDEVWQRLRIAVGNGCWVHHWEDNVLAAQARTEWEHAARAALDWLDPGEAPADASPQQRHETLLHRAVKSILERLRRIYVPEVIVETTWRWRSGFVDSRLWSRPPEFLRLVKVELEVHLGVVVPDVIAEWVAEDGQRLKIAIEVTVSNRIGEARIARLATLGHPVLEIDLSAMGGVLTEPELATLVCDDLVAKKWLIQPTAIDVQRQHLAEMQAEEREFEEQRRQRQEYLATTPTEWAQALVTELELGDGGTDAAGKAIKALEAHGWPAASLERVPLRVVVSRLCRIREANRLESKTELAPIIAGIMSDERIMRRWHPVYLMALKCWPGGVGSQEAEQIAALRQQVLEGLRNKDNNYERDRKFDGLLALLFPELRTALQHKLQVKTSAHGQRKALAPQRPMAFEPPADLSDEELLRSSGDAIAYGHTPMSCARYCAEATGLHGPGQWLTRLMQLGVAADWQRWA